MCDWLFGCEPQRIIVVAKPPLQFADRHSPSAKCHDDSQAIQLHDCLSAKRPEFTVRRSVRRGGSEVKQRMGG
jgi:hypothetical protein